MWIEVVAALAFVVVAAWCWRTAVQPTQFAAVGADAPPFESAQYSGPWVVGATVALAVAGLLAIDVILRLRARRDSAPSVPTRGTLEV